MRYALLIYGPELPPGVEPQADEMTAEMDGYAEFTADVNRRGIFKGGEPLQATPTATTVRVRNGETLTTDGPFAETKEVLGGFYLLECRDLDEAIELAARIPGAKRGSIEIRPVAELPADYTERVEAAGRGVGSGG